jgi:glucan 1,3-beta-glucosidase
VYPRVAKRECRSPVPSAPGAIVVEWNVRDPAGQQGVAAAWDTHVRLGGAAGTSLTDAECLKLTDTGSNCFAAFLGFHLTPSASAYLEGLWVWLADHSLDGNHQQISIYSGRGLLSESQGPVWLVGTGSEHHVLYQYSFVNAANHYGGLMQTETPYFQPAPAPPTPFVSDATFKDPTFNSAVAAWALWVQNSQGILVYGMFSLSEKCREVLIRLRSGAGFYSFFINYNQTCINAYSCQDQIVNIDSASGVHIYQLSTVATTYQLSVDQTPIINQASNRNG